MVTAHLENLEKLGIWRGLGSVRNQGKWERCASGKSVDGLAVIERLDRSASR